ncbi:MAG: hypothetical protein ACFFEW_14790, partial [Candidatus Thorarchaeota archaeon]
EKKRSDEYWMGVRDALRMVDSFNKWAQRNKDRAKDLDDFIHDGLIAAAKRCESCLKDDLGLTFVEGEDHPLSESIPSGYQAKPPEEKSEDVALPPADEAITIESVSRSDSEEMDDIILEGPTREFSSDFELVEPFPLVVDSSPPEPELETTDAEKPSFTWADYEEAVTPSKSDSATEEIDDDEPPFDIEPEDEEEELEELPIEEPVSLEPSKVLTPSDEPAIPTAEYESTIGEGQALPEEEDEEIDAPEPIIEPPAPPPPPESEEDEDERRRRARRLFFGD